MLPFDSQSNSSSINADDALSNYSSTAVISFQSSPSATATVQPVPVPPENPVLNSKKSVNVTIPEAKSEGILPNRVLFSCDIQCTHSIQYKLRDKQEYKQYDLDKLDVILNPCGSITVQCIFLLNGIEGILEYPTWINNPLNIVMKNSGFLPSHNEGEYLVNKAFVTPPLSYLFDKQVPFGVLEKLEIIFDWSSSKPKEFQSCWKRRVDFDTYVEYAFTTILIRKSFCLYPLIFSNSYTKKITQTMAYLPYISQSLQKIYRTSKATMSVSNHEFSESLMQHIKTIHQNTKVMNPRFTDSIEADLTASQMTTALTLGMYHSIKNANKPKTSLKKADTQNPPNALYSVAQLWSITCSASSD